MEILGLVTAVIIYLSLFVMMVSYMILAAKKKYEFSNTILLFSFIHSICTNFILLWSSMIMNSGTLSLFVLRLDYTKLLIIYIPIFLMVQTIDIPVRRNASYKNKFSKFFRYLLPTMFFVLFCVSTLLMYYISHNFAFLITW